jgi:hypothetical protein
MNEKQRLHIVQARSDWKIYKLLKAESICHRLHYFQMCTEKLAKAFFWKNSGAGNLGHAAFVKFVRAMKTKSKVARKLGFDNTITFGEWIKDISNLAYELERLAPHWQAMVLIQSIRGHGTTPNTLRLNTISKFGVTCKRRKVVVCGP